MWKFLLTPFFLFVLHNVSAKNLRKNPDLWTFNTAINANITNKIQDEAVIISLLRLKDIPDELTKEHILFGFDIFNFVPQSFKVSVNYISNKLFMNITSTIDSYSVAFDLKTSGKIQSLFLRLGDEDDTVFLISNCEFSNSVITPINLIKFFRSVSVNKFKILFNKHYELKVFTEDDDMEVKLQKKCNIHEVTPEGQQQLDHLFDQLANYLTKYTPSLISLLVNSDAESEIATEIFIKAFLSKDVIHKSSNVYSIIHLIQSLMKRFPEVFQPDLQELLTKIFWTEGREIYFVRKIKSNYYDDVDIKNNLINILFANSPRTFVDSMRILKDIGKHFRDVFANRQISINQVMSNETKLKSTLLDILFKIPLDRYQLKLLNPNHIITSMFADYYLKDMHVNPNILDNVHKRIIFNADRNDYIAIGKFIRYIFFKDSALRDARNFIEPDLVIGMRVVYVLSSGLVNEKRDIYWTVRNLITKKDVELPKALEYSPNVIIETLNKCYLNAESSRNMFMHTLENLFIYDYPNIGSFLDHDQGAFLYNLYRDLIMNDIQKEKSILRRVLLDASSHLREMIVSIIQSVANNVDNVKELRQIAVDFVNDTLTYAKMNATEIIQTENDYVKLFKKIIGKASSISEKQRKINFKIMLLRIKFDEKVPGAKAVKNALSRALLRPGARITKRLIEVYFKYNNSAEVLIRKVDEILDEKFSVTVALEDIIKRDLKEGVTFFHESASKELETIFHLSEDEDAQITIERYTKMKELNVLEEWYREEVNFLYDVVKKQGVLDAVKKLTEETKTEEKIIPKTKSPDAEKTRTVKKDIPKTKSPDAEKTRTVKKDNPKTKSPDAEKTRTVKKDIPKTKSPDAEKTRTVKMDNPKTKSPDAEKTRTDKKNIPNTKSSDAEKTRTLKKDNPKTKSSDAEKTTVEKDIPNTKSSDAEKTRTLKNDIPNTKSSDAEKTTTVEKDIPNTKSSDAEKTRTVKKDIPKTKSSDNSQNSG